jgi:hypothetical protein
MTELEQEMVAARCDGYVYEGIHGGFHQRGPFEFHVLNETRLINDQNLRVRTQMTYSEEWAPLGTVYLPVGPTVIHKTHFVPR